MFLKSEQYDDAIYAWKDYQADSLRLIEIIDASKNRPATLSLTWQSAPAGTSSTCGRTSPSRASTLIQRGCASPARSTPT